MGVGNRQLAFGARENGIITNDVFYPPQLTDTAIAALSAATYEGCFVYDTVNLNYYFSTGSAWTAFGAAGSTTLTGLTDTDITSAASAEILIYDGANSWDNKAVSGDATISAAGALAVADLTISGEVQGNILYYNGTNWVRLAVGTSGYYLETKGAAANPVWSAVTATTANGLGSPYTLEGGTYDPATTVTSQTTSAAALTIPDFGGTAQEWCFTKVAQTLTNKTLTTPIIVTTDYIADGGGDELLLFTEDATPVNQLGIGNADASSPPFIDATGDDTDIDILLKPKGTGNVSVGVGDKAGVLESNGDFDLTLQTGNATTSALSLVDGADGDLKFVPNGAGKLLTGSGADAYISSAGAYDLILETNDGTDSSNILITDAANGDIKLQPNGSGEVMIGDGAASGKITSNGAFDLVLDTNSGSNSGNITITDGANEDITLTPNGTGLVVPVGLGYTVTAKSSAATLTEAEGGLITVDTSGGAFSLTLPASSGNAGLFYIVKKTDASANACTLDGNASENVDGSATNADIDAQYDCQTIVCDGTQWWITQRWIQ